MRYFVYICFAVVVASSCKVRSSNYCEDAPFHNCKDLIDAAPGCVSDAQCAAPSPVCDLASQVCVMCTAQAASACVGPTPVCDDTNTCRGCTAHEECATGLCLPSGACADAASIAFVDGAASVGNTGCSKQAPCKTLTKALATGKAHVKVNGVLDEQVTISRDVAVYGEAGAKVSSSSNGPILTVGGSAQIQILGLEIANASGESGFGVVLPTTFTGLLTMERVRVSGSSRAGISANGGVLVVRASTIVRNLGGGISVEGGTVQIEHNFLGENGDGAEGGSEFGGIRITTSKLGNRLSHNTIVYNHQKPGGIGAPGVTCTLANFSSAFNIITGNDAGTEFGNQTAGGCTFPTSFVTPGSRANSLGFKSPSTYDYHLTSSSPTSVRDVPGVTTCAGTDIDGQLRPGNALCDLGADEYYP